MDISKLKLCIMGDLDHITKDILAKTPLDMQALNAADKYHPGQTALHLAVLRRKYWLIRELIYKGANIHIQNQYKDTALMTAVLLGMSDVVKVFVQCVPYQTFVHNLTIRNNRNLSCMDVALKTKRLKTAVERLSKLAVARSTRDDDIIDQLHHFVAVGALVSLAAFVGAKTFAGTPINCWIPKEFDKDHYTDYVNSYCWITQIYNVPFSEELPVDISERMSEDRDVSFYRWVMVMFLIQALMFAIPNLLWKTFKTFSGINMEKIVTMTWDTQMKPEKERDQSMKNIAAFVDRWLRTCRRYEQNPISAVKTKLANVVFCFGKHSGCYLTRLYLFIKMLYFINVIVQFEILTSFLGFNYWRYGSEVVEMMAGGTHWRDLDHFPRIGMCDFQIRQLQNVQRFTVQCVLSINLFLEKIYAAQWFIMMMLAIATFISLVMWLVEEVFTSRRERFLEKHIVMLEEDSGTVDRKLFKMFVRRYLRDDGIFLLRVVGNNTSDLLTFDLLKQIWARFKKFYHKDDDEEYNPDIKTMKNSSHI